MALIDDVKTVCDRLAPLGWRDALLAATGRQLDIQKPNAAALKAFAVPTDANKTGAGGQNSKLVTVDRKIAIQRFPINQCSQGDIESFVAQYVNHCAPEDCQTSTSYAK